MIYIISRNESATGNRCQSGAVGVSPERKIRTSTELAKAYDEISPEMSVIRAMVDARTSQQLSQKELAQITGIQQSEISRLENGTRNPSIRLLQRLADGMGMVLKISFEPKAKYSG